MIRCDFARFTGHKRVTQNPEGLMKEKIRSCLEIWKTFMDELQFEMGFSLKAVKGGSGRTDIPQRGQPESDHKSRKADGNLGNTLTRKRESSEKYSMKSVGTTAD